MYSDILRLVLLDYNRALISVCQNGYLEIVYYLLDTSERYKFYVILESIWKALQNGHTDVVLLLFRYLKIRWSTLGPEFYNKVFDWTAWMGNFHVMKFLLNDPQRYGTPSFESIKQAIKNGQTKMALALLGMFPLSDDDQKEDLFTTAAEAENIPLMTAFHQNNFPIELDEEFVDAAVYNRIPVMRLLLQWGADVHVGEDAALLNGVQSQSSDVVKFLLDSGVNPRNKEALAGANPEIRELLQIRSLKN
jgi:hypothetical protein